MSRSPAQLLSLVGAMALLLGAGSGWAAETTAAAWPQWGGTSARNNVAAAQNLPHEWKIGQFDRATGEWQAETAENIRWVARLGSEAYGTPVVLGDYVLCATNNGAAYLPRFPATVDLGCLLCFQRTDGEFVWQLSRPKLAAGRSLDWPEQGICSTPLVEGDRVWVVTNRSEVACLDLAGFRDGENDGPYQAEEVQADNEADIVWLFDLMKSVGSVPHNMTSCSVTAMGEVLLVGTSNGMDEAHEQLPAPEAPSFLALDKHSGKLLWADNSPGENILDGQWSSPACAVLDGVPQAIFAGGDGWLYSFEATARQEQGRPQLLWKFDCNPKASEWEEGGTGERAYIVATPVIHDGLVYVATGHDPEFGEADGHLWCIRPTGRGDVSPELALDAKGQPLPPRREQAVDPAAGETTRPNPHSAVVWHYTGEDADGDGELAFEETMHRTLSSPAVAEGILVIPDLAGMVHGLDARTGKRLWAYDALAAIWGSPLIADGKVYLGDEDGDLAVLRLAREQETIAENNMGDSVYGSPIAVGNILYIATRNYLFAVAQEGDSRPN